MFFLQNHVKFAVIVGVKDVVPVDSITVVLISCHDYDAQIDAQLA